MAVWFWPAREHYQPCHGEMLKEIETTLLLWRPLWRSPWRLLWRLVTPTWLPRLYKEAIVCKDTVLGMLKALTVTSILCRCECFQRLQFPRPHIYCATRVRGMQLTGTPGTNVLRIYEGSGERSGLGGKTSRFDCAATMASGFRNLFWPVTRTA